jgi:branched-chain amino acid transport system substrate-binding protein
MLRRLIAITLVAIMPSVSRAQDQGPLKIGVLEDLSGPYADIAGQGSILAVQMAVDDLGGKVLGRPVVLVSADHQNKPDIGGAIARKWLDADGVEAIFGASTSSVAVAVQQITRERHKIFAFSATGADLTGKQCSPYGSAWLFNTYSVASVIGKALSRQGAKTWFLLSVDYTFGHQLERDLTQTIKNEGGRVVGQVRHPLNSPDFASFLLQAQSSAADVVALANVGTDMTTAVRQASEFGMLQKQKFAALMMFITDINAMGLQTAQGLIHVSGFYWDRTEQSREFSRRFMAKHGGKPPTEVQAAMYSAATHYLKSVARAASTDGTAVTLEMKRTPISDAVNPNASLRQDGRVMKPLYVVQVKSPAESKGPWDYIKILDEVPAEQAFQSIEEGGCALE